MEEAGPGPSSATCSRTEVSDTPKHCVRLTREQYTTLTELTADPLFKRVVLRAVYPSWDQLMEGEEGNRSFTWVVYHLWLGSLKFALLSRCVDGAEELYEKISTIFESLVSEFKMSDKDYYRPQERMKLCFDHLGDGMFHLRLQFGQEIPQVKTPGSYLSAKESRRAIRALSAKAMHVSRTSNWPKQARLVQVKYNMSRVFLSFSDKDGAKVNQERRLIEVSEGKSSLQFRHELRCTISYIAEQMEQRGEMVDWDGLYMKALSVENYRLPSFVSNIGDEVEEFIRQRGKELLQKPCSRD